LFQRPTDLPFRVTELPLGVIERREIVQRIRIVGLQTQGGTVCIFCGLELVGEMVGNAETIVDSRVPLCRWNPFVGIGGFRVLFLIELLIAGGSLGEEVGSEEQKENKAATSYAPEI